jgi:hypothetical protein
MFGTGGGGKGLDAPFTRAFPSRDGVLSSAGPQEPDVTVISNVASAELAYGSITAPSDP